MAFQFPNIFGTRPAAAPAPAAPGAPAAPATGQPPTAPALSAGATAAPAFAGLNPPAAPAPVAPPEPPKNPLDAFTKVWETPDPSKTTPDPLAAPIFGADPAKLQEAARSIDFSKSVPPELMQRMMAGNDPAAIAEMMNLAVQQAVGLSAQLTAQTTEHGFSQYSKRLDQALPGRVSRVQLDQQSSSNPALQHPAAQPLVKMARDAMAASNPGKSPQEIAAMADAYLMQVGSEVFAHSEDGKQVQQRLGAVHQSQRQSQGDNDFDFENWASGAPASQGAPGTRIF